MATMTLRQAKDGAVADLRAVIIEAARAAAAAADVRSPVTSPALPAGLSAVGWAARVRRRWPGIELTSSAIAEALSTAPELAPDERAALARLAGGGLDPGPRQRRDAAHDGVPLAALGVVVPVDDACSDTARSDTPSSTTPWSINAEPLRAAWLAHGPDAARAWLDWCGGDPLVALHAVDVARTLAAGAGATVCLALAERQELPQVLREAALSALDVLAAAGERRGGAQGERPLDASGRAHDATALDQSGAGPASGVARWAGAVRAGLLAELDAGCSPELWRWCGLLLDVDDDPERGSEAGASGGATIGRASAPVLALDDAATLALLERREPWPVAPAYLLELLAARGPGSGPRVAAGQLLPETFPLAWTALAPLDAAQACRRLVTLVDEGRGSQAFDELFLRDEAPVVLSWLAVVRASAADDLDRRARELLAGMDDPFDFDAPWEGELPATLILVLRLAGWPDDAIRALFVEASPGHGGEELEASLDADLGVPLAERFAGCVPPAAVPDGGELGREDTRAAGVHEGIGEAFGDVFSPSDPFSVRRRG